MAAMVDTAVDSEAATAAAALTEEGALVEWEELVAEMEAEVGAL